MRFSRAAEIWAAASLSLLLIGLVALIEFAPEDAWAGVVILLIALVLGESILRATFVRTVNRVAVILALVATVILLVHFWKPVLFGALIALAAFLILQRVREFRA
jgi:MFS superfamily sulfate permease-like transporter